MRKNGKRSGKKSLEKRSGKKKSGKKSGEGFLFLPHGPLKERGLRDLDAENSRARQRPL